MNKSQMRIDRVVSALLWQLFFGMTYTEVRPQLDKQGKMTRLSGNNWDIELGRIDASAQVLNGLQIREDSWNPFGVRRITIWRTRRTVKLELRVDYNQITVEWLYFIENDSEPTLMHLESQFVSCEDRDTAVFRIITPANSYFTEDDPLRVVRYFDELFAAKFMESVVVHEPSQYGPALVEF